MTCPKNAEIIKELEDKFENSKIENGGWEPNGDDYFIKLVEIIKQADANAIGWVKEQWIEFCKRHLIIGECFIEFNNILKNNHSRDVSQKNAGYSDTQSPQTKPNLKDDSQYIGGGSRCSEQDKTGESRKGIMGNKFPKSRTLKEFSKVKK